MDDKFIESVIRPQNEQTKARNIMTIHREFHGMMAVQADDDKCEFDPEGGEDE